METAFKYRFYPTPEQESLLRRTLGCCKKKRHGGSMVKNSEVV
ncbi:helix-turn-helix domain-containing protein [Neosynechococcus sphagnicola]